MPVCSRCCTGRHKNSVSPAVFHLFTHMTLCAPSEPWLGSVRVNFSTIRPQDALYALARRWLALQSLQGSPSMHKSSRKKYPVFPLVESISVFSRLSTLLYECASTTICRAVRSLTEPPGLRCSAFAYKLHRIGKMRRLPFAKELAAYSLFETRAGKLRQSSNGFSFSTRDNNLRQVIRRDTHERVGNSQEFMWSNDTQPVHLGANKIWDRR